MVTDFERQFADFIGVKHAIATNSGTAALHAALLAGGVGPGDEVVVPSLTFVSAAEVVVLAGARPVFADIDPETYCLSPESTADALTERTKAIIPTHLFGLPCDMDAICSLARERNLVAIEDSAQAIGAEWKGKKTGSIGDFGCFSFYATKHITTGEGGLVSTNDDSRAEALRVIRIHGESELYSSSRLGHNYRMSELAAAIGLAQLRRLPEFLEARRRNAEFLTDKLKDLNFLQLPVEPNSAKHSWYVYTVRLKGASAARRDEVVRKLRTMGIKATVYYPVPIHRMPYYARFARGKLVHAEEACSQIFSLPVHPALTPSDMEYVAQCARTALESFKGN